jgi:hypothetical protein
LLDSRPETIVFGQIGQGGFVLALGGVEIHGKINPKAARKLAVHAGGAVLQGKLVSEGGKLALLDAGFTWIDPKARAQAAAGGGGE